MVRAADNNGGDAHCRGSVAVLVGPAFFREAMLFSALWAGCLAKRRRSRHLTRREIAVYQHTTTERGSNPTLHPTQCFSWTTTDKKSCSLGCQRSRFRPGSSTCALCGACLSTSVDCTMKGVLMRVVATAAVVMSAVIARSVTDGSSPTNTCSDAAGSCAEDQSASGQSSLRCMDRRGWVDSYGYTCDMYVDRDYCTPSGGFGRGWDAGWGSNYRDYVSVDGFDATQACCGCGGGLRIGAKPVAKPMAPMKTATTPKISAATVATPKRRSSTSGPEPSTARELVDDDFSSFVDSMATAVVMFYAPWCGACKNFKPVFEAVSSKLAGTPRLGFARVDATANPVVQRRFKISSYPTVHIFTGGESTKAAHAKVPARTPTALEEFVLAVHENRPVPLSTPAGKAKRKPKKDPKMKPRAYRDVEPRNSFVKSFDAAALRSAIRSHPEKTFVVKMFAEWCSHCKQVFPEFTQASILLNEDGVNAAVLAKVNIYDKSGVNDMMPHYYGIKSTPAFVMFKDGDPDTMFNFDLPGDERQARSIARIVTELVTGRRPFPAPQLRYCVEDDICFFEMPCNKQTWSGYQKLFAEKGWGHDAVTVSGSEQFESVIAAKEFSWVLFLDHTKCPASIMMRVALELSSLRAESVDSIDQESRQKWNVVVVDTHDPANKALVAAYVPHPRPEGQSVQIFSASDPHHPTNMDLLMYPIAPSLPTHSADLYVLGLGMIKTIWTVRLNSALFEHWGSSDVQTSMHAVIEEQWDEFLGDGKRDFVAEDFEEFKAMYRRFKPADAVVRS